MGNSPIRSIRSTELLPLRYSPCDEGRPVSDCEEAVTFDDSVVEKRSILGVPEKRLRFWDEYTVLGLSRRGGANNACTEIQPMQVIGAGFGRTGTMSMQAALELLGYRCYHMKEITEHPGHL
jgi:hypothetical protein